jgi:hypothetical protein
MAEKKIRFSGEDNVSPVFSKIKRESEELGRGLIRDARAYTTSGKETLAYIEQQIKAIERRSKLERESQMLQVESQKQRGMVSPEAAQQKIQEIKLSSKEDEQQVTLLRELIETIKASSRKEIAEDRKGVETQIKSDKRLEQLSPKGDELEILKRTLQRQQLGDVKYEEQEEKDRFSGVKSAAQKVGAVGSMAAGSQNEFYMAAAVFSFIPFIGGALSSLTQRALGAVQQYQSAAGEMSQLTGGGYGRFMGRGGAMSSIGLTRAEFLGINREVAMARGQEAGSYGAAQNIAYLQKGTGISRQLLLEQERLARSGGMGALGGTQELMRSLQSVGVVKGQETTILEEYIPLLVQLQKEQLNVSGETNTTIATKLVSGIASLDESFKNPDVLRGVLPSLMGGLRKPSTPQVEALQFSVLSGMSPGASLSELQEMRESPTLEYFKSTLDQLRSMSPNEEMLIQNIKGVFGLEGQTGIARRIARGEVSLEDYTDQQGIVDFKGRAIGATGALDRSSAEWNQKFERYGQEALTFLDKIQTGIVDGFTDMISGFMDFKKAISEMTDKIEFRAPWQNKTIEHKKVETKFKVKRGGTK